MKNFLRRAVPAFLIFIAAAAAVLIGIIYFNIISKRIYDDSTDHLRELYRQVNHSFASFIDRNWDLLDSSGKYFTEAGSDDAAARYIEYKKDYWTFSDFCFLASDGSCVTVDGREDFLDIDPESLEVLMDENEPVMASDDDFDGQETVIFASPVQGSYKGFEYDALAITYTNADLASSLNVDAFSGKAMCFVIRGDGSVLLSTVTGGNVFGNYLVYLNAASDIGENGLGAKLLNDWENQREGLFRCKIAGVDSVLLYQPVGYKDYTLLSVVPISAVSANFLSIRNTTIAVFIVIATIIFASLIGVLLMRLGSLSRKNRTELKYRERMFDVLSNTVDDIFIMLDHEDHSVDYISPNLERLLGINVEDARKNIRVMERCAVNFNVVMPKEELAAIPLNGSKYWECEYMHQNTGERRWYRMTIYSMTLQGIGKYIIVMSDRTHEQQMNQKLSEALTSARSANEAKSNFLSNMSHDIRTPMNAIVGFSTLLENDADDPEKVREYSRKITASSHHLLSLINDVLDMSKIESGKTSLNTDRFSLRQLLEEINIILAPQAKAKNQEFDINISGDPPDDILGDKLRLNQILINLLSNAVKYTQEGGKIEFSVDELPKPSAQYSKLRFTVRDNGIGMSEEFQKHVFAPFSREISSVTNKIQGTGLGMAITKNLVDLMGGIISVKSKPGEGSVFTVELSFLLPEHDGQEQWFKSKISRMLVCDDEEEICRGVRDTMSAAGVDVSCATSGMEAVNMAEEAHLRGDSYGVILLDWKMPGMNGVETAKEIRKKVGDDVPIMVLTSYDWADIEEEARSAGINAFMPKPFYPGAFREAIEPVINSGAVKNKPKDNAIGSLKGLRFLIAEDNDLNAEILTEMLSIEGAESELAVNGLEAVKMFKNAEKGHYDMILMDVQMPVMNGYEATREIRKTDKDIPIAAMTANTFAEDVRNSAEAGMNGHLAKPIDMNSVRSLVIKLIGSKNSEKNRESNA